MMKGSSCAQTGVHGADHRKLVCGQKLMLIKKRGKNWNPGVIAIYRYDEEFYIMRIWIKMVS